MTLHPLRDTPPPWLGEALERFEVRFSYPLGDGVSFRISHGRSYLSFFQAMGDATVWVAERDGEVLGTLAAIRRSLHLTGGELRRVAYLCDLKVLPEGRSGRALPSLARAAVKSLREQGVESAYSVVMSGTSRTPDGYTGRLGIPHFTNLGGIMVCKVETRMLGQRSQNTKIVTPRDVDAAYHSLSRSLVFAEACRPALRSLMVPVPLMEGDDRACGMVDDTRRGKRLWLNTGTELGAAHLSRFAYASIEGGARLVRDASAIAAEAGFAGMFFAITVTDVPAFTAALADLNPHLAPATIYGCGLPMTLSWGLDTSEI